MATLGITVAMLICSIVIGAGVGRIVMGLMWFKRFPARYLILPVSRLKQ